MAFGKVDASKALSSRRSPVNVIAPLIVAALGNRNDIVGVIDAVDDHGVDQRSQRHDDAFGTRVCWSYRCSLRLVAWSLTAWITNTMSFPLPSAATIRGAITGGDGYKQF